MDNHNKSPDSRPPQVGDTMPEYRLVSFDLCPFVQRSVITLEETGTPYKIDYIDLSNKPDWFLEISPLGKVPLLRVGSTILFESAVINEYLDEMNPTRRLHPQDPLERAHHRAWIEFTSVVLTEMYRMSMAEDEPKTRELASTIQQRLRRYEDQLERGPLFAGTDFSLVDSAAAPLFQRLHWCQEICPDLNLWDGLAKAPVWRDTLLARESVQRSTVPDIADRFVSYLKGKGSPTRQAVPSWLGKIAS